MAKIDKLLQQLEESEMFIRFVKRAARSWYEEKSQVEPSVKTIEKVVEKPVDRIVEKEKIIEKKVVQEVIPQWAKDLERHLQTVQQIQQHPNLASILLGDAQHNAQQIVRFLVCGAQWSNILRIWDVLAEQVKQTQQPISMIEQQILEQCLALYNQTLTDCHAQLQKVDTGITYDYEKHQRANSRGDHIQTVLLQGLLNAADDVVRSAVVLTQ